MPTQRNLTPLISTSAGDATVAADLRMIKQPSNKEELPQPAATVNVATSNTGKVEAAATPFSNF